MNKIIYGAVSIFICMLFAAFIDRAALSFSQPKIAHSPAEIAISADSIKTSYLGRSINMDEIPPGFYVWQLNSTYDELFKDNLNLINSPASEDAYRNFKLKPEKGPWIKLLLKADHQSVFTTSGLIATKSGDPIAVLETISNRIKTSINESRFIKLSDESDQSAKNIYAAIYNAIMQQIKLSPLEKIENLASKKAVETLDLSIKSEFLDAKISKLTIFGAIVAIYFEMNLPKYFNEVKIAMVIKTSGQICKFYIASGKQNFYISGGIRRQEFMDEFKKYLISDISSDNKNLMNESGASFTKKRELIKILSNIAPTIKSILDKINDTSQEN